MAKVNTPGRASGTGPFATEATSRGKTHESGKGSPYPESELSCARLPCSREPSFYEAATSHDDRRKEQAHQLASEDRTWTSEFLKWLRSGGKALLHRISSFSIAPGRVA